MTDGDATSDPKVGADDHGARLARYYDLDLADDPGDLPLYLASALRSGGPVLELGAGTGRVAIPLAAAGYDVTAVDHDRHMLARARAGWRAARAIGSGRGTGRLSLRRDDICSLALEERFGLVILALDTLASLGHRDSQQQAISVMARHLRADGLAIIDAWLPTADDITIYDGRLQLEWVRDDSGVAECVAKLASARYDAATSTIAMTTFFDHWPAGGGTIRRASRWDLIRPVSAADLVAMVEASGMVVERLAGDHQMGTLGPGAERVVLVGRLV